MERRPIDRLLPALLALLIGASGLMLFRGFRSLEHRASDLAGLAQLRAHQMLGIRLDAQFHELEEDLMEEAQAVKTGMDTAMLLQRWRVLIESHWAINSIRLADEAGNEFALHRDSALWLVRTTAGNKDTLPSATRLHDGVPDSIATPWATMGRYDPRERIWFSKALENDRDAPAWSERQFGDTSTPVLQLSITARLQDALDYHVLMLDVDLERAALLDVLGLPLSRYGLALLTAEGRGLAYNRATLKEPLMSAMRTAIETWLAQKQVGTFILEMPEARYSAQATACQLNGLPLIAVVVMDLEALDDWLLPERRILALAAAALAIFTLCLLLLAWRARKRRKAAGLLALQARQLEYKLTKASGEREVLSREVHHRVKNNLQVVSSLLNLQASSLDDEHVREEFLRGKRRIDTIALVHHRLYDHPDLRDIDLGVFLKQLTASIAEMQGEKRLTVSIAVESHGIRADQDTAIELGIIVCELVTNAFQHAFPHATGGHISLEVTKVEGDLHRLVVSNNGVPPKQGAMNGPGKLGLEIVEALADQLDGSLHVRTDVTPSFEVLFRMRTPGSTDVADA